jgi:hypothetical protein
MNNADRHLARNLPRGSALDEPAVEFECQTFMVVAPWSCPTKGKRVAE